MPKSENHPLVSVLIPTYNMSQTLGAALESTMSQDYPELEIIVSDNHSTDNTPEILAAFAGQGPLRVVHPEKHVSMYGNFNCALRFARGDIVKFLCADDVLLPGAISCIVEHFQEYPSVGVLQFAGPRLDEHGQELGVYQHNRHIRMGLWSGAKLALVQVPSMDMATPSHTAFRRDLLEWASIDGKGPFDESMIQADWDLLLRIFPRCDVFRIADALVGYRVTGYHMNNIDTTWALSDALVIADKHYRRRWGTNRRSGQCRRIIQNDVSERFVWWIFKRLLRGELSLAGKALRILDEHNLVFRAGLNALCRSPLYLSRRFIKAS